MSSQERNGPPSTNSTFQQFQLQQQDNMITKTYLLQLKHEYTALESIFKQFPDVYAKSLRVLEQRYEHKLKDRNYPLHRRLVAEREARLKTELYNAFLEDKAHFIAANYGGIIDLLTRKMTQSIPSSCCIRANRMFSSDRLERARPQCATTESDALTTPLHGINGETNIQSQESPKILLKYSSSGDCNSENSGDTVVALSPAIVSSCPGLVDSANTPNSELQSGDLASSGDQQKGRVVKYSQDDTATSLRRTLRMREAQIERLTAELNETNNDCDKMHNALVAATDRLERTSTRCIELQVELNRSRRFNRDLETKLWHLERAQMFRKTLTASAVPITVMTPTSGDHDRDRTDGPSLSSVAMHQSKVYIPAPDYLAAFRADVLASIRELESITKELSAPLQFEDSRIPTNALSKLLLRTRRRQRRYALPHLLQHASTKHNARRNSGRAESCN